ncbi:MAG: cytochrome b N-terminal domain-containing protein [Anaerolineales bacterium]|jgi:quinol-cytochrome oxidoreductase complex cytochrome b subunit|nr:cytochrome b N-terminal domain-containing protein [Anaerolineales bacterium]
MNKTDSNQQPTKMFERIYNALGPSGLPTDDRGRMRMVVNNLVLHLHPTKVPVRTLRLSYTWGLGGLSGMLIMFLAFTGIFLQMNYTPSPSQAYLDILALRNNVWFGDLLRSIHHWSANLLVVITFLHLLRVFFTGGHRAPRETNWLVGIAMLLLVLGANFTGYLLPWDQLAYWAITVGTSILTYIPIAGPYLSRLLLGGPEVSAATLLNFYSLHISFIPLLIVSLMSLHFWRVRKDGGLTIPKSPDETEKPRMERVTTIPHLVRREMAFALVWTVILLGWAILVSAPLEGIANPEISPNPAKSPWYFLGLQELLLHFHPLVGAVIIPGLALTALALLPFYDVNSESVGIYFRSWRGRYLSLLSAGLALIIVPTWVVLDEFVLNWSDWLTNWPSIISNGLIPLSIVLLGLIGLDETVKKYFHANKEERILVLFTFLLIALIVLTAVGIFFRGPGMSLYWPWNMPTH